MQKLTPKNLVCLGIELLIAGLHILGPGRRAGGEWFVLSASYFSDLTLPFGFYFLLCISEDQFRFLRPWWVKALLVFSAAVAAETLQALGVYALGGTFDPLDYGMYAAGVLLAAALEQGIMRRVLPFWEEKHAAVPRG
ncbi:hypothetical protein ADN00_10185 [Ornatilinea apprima]|uniref:VanZ-like domain-containing protein n=1 Tax=Ornatilinea apprima TaxID=1134406 RepID=A0A0P6XUA1_9CHLR|nr:hypothetical protein [Ornatilinea apprima]KPL76948.1 hypothetical protein ADN00_10185 [Ornatilinea apprima]